MATQLFFTSTPSEYGTGNNDANLAGTAIGWLSRALSSSRGGGVTSNSVTSVAGPTNGIEIGSTQKYVWYSQPLDADVTVSGSVTWNLRAAYSSMTSNAAVNGRLEVIDGATGTITLIDQTTRTTEPGTSESAQNFAETPGAGVACKRGDRLRVRVFFDDSVDGNMASGATLTFWYNGTSAAASGDSYLTLTENLTFVSEPAGTTIYPTDTASAVSTASVDREAWTSRGAGVQTDVTNTAAGWTAPIQVTDTAGGTVVDWFTEQLTAFTLGGAARVNARFAVSAGAGANAGYRCEVARVASDGTSPTAWAGALYPVEAVNANEGAKSFLIAGDDLAVSDGQRLRIRFLIDDYGENALAAGGTATLYYAGTSGGASGDTYLTFTQTLTEFSAGTTVTPTTAALVITENIPTVTASNHQSVTPTTATLTSATYAPAVRLGTVITVPTAGGAGYVAAVLADSPVGYWRMGEASGSVLDSIGSSHGTATGTTRDVTGALTTAQDDGAITFNGTSDKVRMGDVLDQTGAVSYELWVKRANTTGVLQYLMNKGAGQPNIVLKADHYITVGEENFDLVLSSTAILNDTNWHHIVFTWTGAAAVDAAKLYVDGVNVGVHQNTATIAGNGSSLSLGAAYVDALYFAGTIDEAAIYNTVLSPTRVLAHYNAGITAGGLVLTTYAPTIRQGIGVIPTTKALALATFAPTVTASNHQSVTPTTAVLTITENVPTVTASNHQSVTPTTSSLALTAFAPVVTATDQQTVTPTTAALLLSAFAPSVTATADQTVIPTSATVVLTGNAPTVTAEADVTVIPGTASVTTTTYAPTVSAAQHVSVIPGTAVLTVTELVPTATVSDHQRVTPATAVLTITEQVPAAQTPSRVVPATAPLATTKFAPTVTTPQTLTAGLKTLTTATFAPTITNPQTYVPAKATLTLSAFAPTVDVTAASTIVIPKATLTATRYAPTVTANQHVMVTPNAATLVTSPQVPTVAASDHQRVTPSTKAVVLTSSAPMVDVSDQQAIVPGRATLAITAYAPTVSASADIAVIPGTKVLQLLGYAPTARVANRATPATTTLVLTTLAPIVTPTLNTLVRPNHNVLTITEYGPVLEISGHAAFTPITAGLLLTTYPPTAETHSITPLPRPIYGFAIVATGPGASVGTAAGGATVRSVEGGSTAVSTSGPSARVRIR
jgi:hypothetical protein